MSHKFFRRFLNLLLSLGAVFVLIACSISPSPTLTSPTDTAIPPTSTPQGRTLHVTSPADSGPGTLRQAMHDAQPYDVITFEPSVFPPDGPATIPLSSVLPEIRQGNLTIDASDAGVILDGGNITDSAQGLAIWSNYNIIRGLQIIGFPNAGIGIYGQYNTIGGDRSVGDGHLGQGNLISGNGQFGIGLWGEDTSQNTIQGNYIGVTLDGKATWGNAGDGIHSNGATQNLITDNIIGGNGNAGVMLCCVVNGNNTVTENLIGIGPSGSPLGNEFAGILIDHTSHNVVGPGNTIAHNLDGIVFWENTPSNTITQNSIRDNGRRAMDWTASGQIFQPPLIISWDLQAGSLSGIVCANCIVEIFSGNTREGAFFEGKTTADEKGIFAFNKEMPFIGSHLTATATDMGGNSSDFSGPVSGTARSVILQQGNELPIAILELEESRKLADNRIGANQGGIVHPDTWFHLVAYNASGLKRIDIGFYEIEPPIDWSTGSELAIPAGMDEFVNGLAEIGITMNLGLHFWDKAGHAAGEELSTPRFQDDKQVQDYADFVRFVVRHFKGRIPYYTIWSEPDYCGDGGIKCILPEDYIALVRRIIPVIREEDPEARIVSAPYTFYNGRISDDLFTLLTSDVLRQFDVISWHAIYDVTPDNKFYGNFYYEYPAIIQEIKRTASAHGFLGEYWGTDLQWNSTEYCSQYWDYCAAYLATDPRAQGMVETDLQVAKYYARGIVMQLGLDVAVGQDGFLSNRLWTDPTIRNLNTVMAGNEPLEIPVEIESDATHLTSYGFSLPNGGRLFVVWNDNVAVDYDPGIPSTLTFPGTSAQKVIGIDVLHGFEQELIIEIVDGNLVIRDLLIKDYPIILRLNE